MTYAIAHIDLLYVIAYLEGKALEVYARWRT